MLGCARFARFALQAELNITTLQNKTTVFFFFFAVCNQLGVCEGEMGSAYSYHGVP